MRTPLAVLTLVSFLISLAVGPMPGYAQDYHLPAPGAMVHLSPEFNPPILKGIKVHPDNPFRFDFILDKGDSELSNNQLKDESTKLIKYFLASLTIPEKDLWVNLSPYEKDRIVPNSFGLTEMGRDLLAEDYMLKQITASLIYPEDEIGKKFWERIYEEAQKRYGTTNVPVNTFNKVWIVPEKAEVYENEKAGTAYVVESKLKVMLEQDYLSLEKHEGIQSEQPQIKGANQLGSQIVREIVIPELTKEVNEGKNFARLRQVYNSLILATWYKKKIKDSILEQVYADKNKVAGVNIDDPKEKERIYRLYLRAFKKGVYNYIKEDIDPVTQETIPRKYFSGGVKFDAAMIIDYEPMNKRDFLRKVGLGVAGLLVVAAGVNSVPHLFKNEKHVGPTVNATNLKTVTNEELMAVENKLLGELEIIQPSKEVKDQLENEYEVAYTRVKIYLQAAKISQKPKLVFVKNLNFMASQRNVGIYLKAHNTVLLDVGFCTSGLITKLEARGIHFTRNSLVHELMHANAFDNRWPSFLEEGFAQFFTYCALVEPYGEGVKGLELFYPENFEVMDMLRFWNDKPKVMEDALMTIYFKGDESKIIGIMGRKNWQKFLNLTNEIPITMSAKSDVYKEKLQQIHKFINDHIREMETKGDRAMINPKVIVSSVVNKLKDIKRNMAIRKTVSDFMKRRVASSRFDYNDLDPSSPFNNFNDPKMVDTINLFLKDGKFKNSFFRNLRASGLPITAYVNYQYPPGNEYLKIFVDTASRFYEYPFQNGAMWDPHLDRRNTQKMKIMGRFDYDKHGYDASIGWKLYLVINPHDVEKVTQYLSDNGFNFKPYGQSSFGLQMDIYVGSWKLVNQVAEELANNLRPWLLNTTNPGRYKTGMGDTILLNSGLLARFMVNRNDFDYSSGDYGIPVAKGNNKKDIGSLQERFLYTYGQFGNYFYPLNAVMSTDQAMNTNVENSQSRIPVGFKMPQTLEEWKHFEFDILSGYPEIVIHPDGQGEIGVSLFQDEFLNTAMRKYSFKSWEIARRFQGHGMIKGNSPITDLVELLTENIDKKRPFYTGTLPNSERPDVGGMVAYNSGPFMLISDIDGFIVDVSHIRYIVVNNSIYDNQLLPHNEGEVLLNYLKETFKNIIFIKAYDKTTGKSWVDVLTEEVNKFDEAKREALFAEHEVKENQPLFVPISWDTDTHLIIRKSGKWYTWFNISLGRGRMKMYSRMADKEKVYSEGIKIGEAISRNVEGRSFAVIRTRGSGIEIRTTSPIFVEVTEVKNIKSQNSAQLASTDQAMNTEDASKDAIIDIKDPIYNIDLQKDFSTTDGESFSIDERSKFNLEGAIKAGRWLRFSLNDEVITWSTKSKFDALAKLFAIVTGNENVGYVAKESLKNAFAHGNKADKRLPIMIRFNFQEQKLLVFDSHKMGSIEPENWGIAYNAGMFGQRAGIREMAKISENSFKKISLRIGDEVIFGKLFQAAFKQGAILQQSQPSASPAMNVEDGITKNFEIGEVVDFKDELTRFSYHDLGQWFSNPRSFIAYHGTITDRQAAIYFANNQTMGDGLYLTTQPAAKGYAKLRKGNKQPVLEKYNVELVKLYVLREGNALSPEIELAWREWLDTHVKPRTDLGFLVKDAILSHNTGKLGRWVGALTHWSIGPREFSKFMGSQGYDGVVGFEAEGEIRGHLSIVIFDRTKPKLLESKLVDLAQSADQTLKVIEKKTTGPGGIDLTPAHMNLQTQNAGEGIKFHLDPAQLAQLQNAPGFVPVIINIQPLKSLSRFLGLNQPPYSNEG